jgi:hypothetical protein
MVRISWPSSLVLPARLPAAAMAPQRPSPASLADHGSLPPSISGHVRWGSAPDDPGVAGATIYAGDQYSTTTDSNGVYTITNVLSGTYLLTATIESHSACLEYDFDPPVRSVALPPSVIDQDFAVSPLVSDPAIIGLIEDASGVGIGDVSLVADGLPPVTTDANGQFRWWPVACEAAYRVTPYKAGYAFAPPFITLTVPVSGALHFVGSETANGYFLPLILDSPPSNQQ